MNNLVRLGEKTFVLLGNTNVGFYKYYENNVCIIDSGSNIEDVNMIIDVLEKKNWSLKIIINTHSHADHIAGNKLLQEKYNCRIYCDKKEVPLINNTLLSSSLFYGSNPISDLKNPFIMGESSICDSVDNIYVPGIKFIELQGHSLGMMGILTDDSVLFVGDAYANDEIIKKYSLQYVYNVEKYLKTLSFLKKQNFKYYIASHDKIRENITDVIDSNIANCNNIIKTILNIIGDEIPYELLIKKVVDNYKIKINLNQYFLISSNIKAYLTFLYENSLIKFDFKDNELIILKIS